MLYLTQITDVIPPNSLNGLVARPKRFELLTPDLRLVPLLEIRTIYLDLGLLLRVNHVTLAAGRLLPVFPL